MLYDYDVVLCCTYIYIIIIYTYMCIYIYYTCYIIFVFDWNNSFNMMIITITWACQNVGYQGCFYFLLKAIYLIACGKPAGHSHLVHRDILYEPSA